jgi:hypothetical protein
MLKLKNFMILVFFGMESTIKIDENRTSKSMIIDENMEVDAKVKNLKRINWFFKIIVVDY